MRSYCSLLWMLVLLAAGCDSPTAGDEVTSISGLVRDAEQADQVVADAKVTIPALGLETFTDEHGLFIFRRAFRFVGYIARIEHPDYLPLEQRIVVKDPVDCRDPNDLSSCTVELNFFIFELLPKATKAQAGQQFMPKPAAHQNRNLPEAPSGL